MNRTTRLSGDSRIRDLRPWANELQLGCYYKRKRFLDATGIGYGLDQIEVLLDIMEPMTHE